MKERVKRLTAGQQQQKSNNKPNNKINNKLNNNKLKNNKLKNNNENDFDKFLQNKLTELKYSFKNNNSDRHMNNKQEKNNKSKFNHPNYKQFCDLTKRFRQMTTYHQPLIRDQQQNYWGSPNLNYSLFIRKLFFIVGKQQQNLNKRATTNHGFYLKFKYVLLTNLNKRNLLVDVAGGIN